MNKILMLSAIGALACLHAPPTDDGGPTIPLLDTPPEAEVEAAAAAIAAAAAAAEVEAARAAAAAEPKSHANPRTQARLDPTKKPIRTGARARKPKAVEEAAADPDSIVGIVLQTSRVTGADGRAIPRRTVALAKSARADSLIGRGWARAATEAETAAATIVLD